MSTKREIFEDELHKLVNELETKSEDYTLLNSALIRLRQNPKLFAGDPNGIFTYEDPILANAAYTYYQNENGRLPTLVADFENGKFIDKNNWRDWVIPVIKMYLSQGDETYKILSEKIPQQSIKVDKSTMRIAIIGDAGFRGQVQKNVLHKIEQIHNKNPFDYLVHLGDIYFAGTTEEMLHHFISPFKRVCPNVLAVLGNHDLYNGGMPFLDVIDTLNQPGRFFAIENENWCLACLDTALHSTDFFRLDGALDEIQLSWLEELIKNNSQKGIILLSHHYIDSYWSKGSDSLRKQLKPFLPKIFSWYWGHEHNCATYHKNTVGYYGACLGNGVFMEEWSNPINDTKPEWYPKDFCSCSKGKFENSWQHGFLELQISMNKIVETYHLESEIYIREIEKS